MDAALKKLFGSEGVKSFPIDQSSGDLWRRLFAANDIGAPITASIPGSERSEEYMQEHGFVDGHAYSVLGAHQDDDGRRWVDLRNPWGYFEPGRVGQPAQHDDGQFTVDLEEFKRRFAVVSYVDLSSS